MGIFRIILLSLMLSFSLMLSGCQGNNSDILENNVTALNINNTLPSIDVNSTKNPVTLQFVFSNDINVSSSGQEVAIYIRAFDSSGTLNTEGSITVQYPQKTDAGQFSPNTATIVDGIAKFTYTAPTDLQGRVDAGDKFSDYTFFSTINGTVSTSLHVNYTPGSSISIGEAVLQKLTLSESTINISQSGTTKSLTLFASTNQSTTDIDLSVGIKYGDTGIDVGYFNPSSPSIVDGRVSFTYNGPLNLLNTSKTLATTVFTLYDKANPGITAPLTVNFVPNLPVIRAESPTIALTTNSEAKTVTILAFDSVTNQAFESGTILIAYPAAITNGSVSGGTFTQNEASIVNGKAIFSFVGPNPLAQISDQVFTFKYKENQTVSTSMTVKYTPQLPSIARLAINEVNTTISQDKQVHTVVINAIDSNGGFVTEGTINVKFPNEISSGTDLGSFTSLSVPVVNGQAKFTYSGPESVLGTSGKLTTGTFEFSDAAGIATAVNWNVTYNPEVPVIRLMDATITLTKNSEIVTVQVLAFDENNQSLDTGTIIVTYPTEIINQNANGGRFLENEAAISSGVASFTFEGPQTLENITDLVFSFSYKGNASVISKSLTISYTPTIATVILNQNTKEVTLNSETFNIDVDVRDSNNNPFTTGSVKIVYPPDVTKGRDIGSFISSEIFLDSKGKASFIYTAPKNLDINKSNIKFGFYHDSGAPEDAKEFIVTIKPEPNQIILTDYALTSSYTDGNITMDLQSTKLITFYVKDKDGNLLNDSNITSMVVSVLNTALADIDDSNSSNPAAEVQTLTKNSASLSIISNTISGVVPIKVFAKFKGVNNEDANLTEVFNVIIVSGPPTAMSISYVSTSNDALHAKFVEKMVVAITDKYSNRVNSNPGLSVSLIAGYARDTSGPLNYMYHTNGGIIDTIDDKLKVVAGTIMKADVTNNGQSYAKAPDVAVTVPGGGSGFTARAYLSNYGGISDITMLSNGKEYVSPPTVTVTGSGSGFSGTATLSSTGTFFTKKISSTTSLPIINLDNPGQGYTSVPSITVTNAGAGSGFDAVAILENTGSLKSISIDVAGSGYAVGDVLPVDGDGSGASVKVKAIGGAGEITELVVLDAGSGYTSASIDTLTKGNLNATLTATIGFSIKEVQLRNGGSGYNDDALTVLGGSPTVNAIASAQIGYGISGITVNSVGSGYRSASIILSNEGDGSEAVAIANIKYPVSNIEIINGGSGYSNGALTLTPKVGDTGTGAKATATVFSDFSTVTENGSINDDFLMTFANNDNNYTYNASGKWDITSLDTVNNFERVLKDQYDGNTTLNLGFAIGNNFRQDICKFGQEWVATATTPVPAFDSNGLAEIDITYDYYLAAKDIMLSANLVGAQNSIGQTVKIGEAIKHSLRGTGLVADILNLPVGLNHAVYRIKVDLKDTPIGTFRNSNFAYTIEATGTDLIIHNINDSMDDGIHNCPSLNDQGRAYVEVEVSTGASTATITLGSLAISREFK
ncbi:hypothetical protein GJV85_11070 [Sulfurimonas aquatica]|uniref:Uncharacterized protein n=1 Tax=Sulfurimonas aquatica TaxID=2672570 RepID=A0A975B1W5_9BACT|nr:hypothetical protein [Sulfurimonas aquatica]QSZ42625.1 hypothetical protein GJV85_11070 [Sulfurimonas aquatica]